MKIIAALAFFVMILGPTGCAGLFPKSFDPNSLENTGAGPEGTEDTAYILLSGPTCPAGSCRTYVTVSDDFPAPYRLMNTPAAKWIEPVGPNNDVHPAGRYVFRTTFPLTGVKLGTVVIDGQWATDDFGRDILINGVSTGNISPSLNEFSRFTIKSGFHPGINTLDFVVDNDDPLPGNSHLNPTGLIVEFVKNGLPPEPSKKTVLSKVDMEKLTWEWPEEI